MKNSFRYILVLIIVGLSFAQEEWQPTDGPYGAWIYDLYEAENGDVFAGTFSGVYRLNEDNVWELKNDGVTPTDSTDTRQIFAVMSFIESNGNLISAQDVLGLYLSSDNGDHWTFVDGEQNDDLSYILDFAKRMDNDNEVVYAISYGDMWKSGDGGASWQRVDIPYGPGKSVAATSEGELFTGSNSNQVYRSLENDANWTAIPVSGDDGSVITVVTMGADTVFAILQTRSPFGYCLVRSLDNGSNGTWEEIKYPFGADSLNIRDVYVHESGEVYALTRSGKVFKSQDGGDTWGMVTNFAQVDQPQSLKKTNTMPEPDHFATILIKRNQDMIIGSISNGTYFFNLINSFAFHEATGLRDVWVYAIDMIGDIIYAATSSGLWYSTNEGNTWEQLSQLPLYDLAREQGSDVLYAIGQTPGTALRYDPETGLVEFLGGMDPLYINFIEAKYTTDYPSNSLLYGIDWNGDIYQSIDIGDSWSLMVDDIGYPYISDFKLNIDYQSLVVGSGNSDSLAIVSISDPPTVTKRDVFPDKDDNIRTIAVDKETGVTYVAGNNGLARTFDGGETWEEIPYPNLGLFFEIKDIVYHDGALFLATNTGVYIWISDEFGDWYKLSDKKANDLINNLQNLFVNSSKAYSKGYSNNPVVDAAELNILAGTRSFSIWKLDYTTEVDDKPAANLPQSFALGQNYPNPFNPATTIRYQLSQPGRVDLVIYNLKGQKIRSLVNRKQPSGHYSVTWDGSNDAGQRVASGMYLYRIKVGDQLASRKMMLLK